MSASGIPAKVASADAERSKAFWKNMYAAMGRRLRVEDPALFVQRLFAQFTTIESYTAIEGAREALMRLRAAGLKIVAASNWEPWLLDLLDHLELRECFDAPGRVGARGRGEADAEFFERALEIPEQRATRPCILAIAFLPTCRGRGVAGLDAIWINWDGSPPQDCPTVDTIGAAADAVIAAARRNEAP